jgi:HJR/Mrr/RecB family endonuclease
MQPTDALPSVNLKGFLRYVAGLLNRCPHWVASLTPDQGHAIAQSPAGLRYLVQVEAQAPAHEGALQAAWAAQQTHRADRTLLIAVNGQYSPPFRELAQAGGVHLWTPTSSPTPLWPAWASRSDSPKAPSHPHPPRLRSPPKAFELLQHRFVTAVP